MPAQATDTSAMIPSPEPDAAPIARTAVVVWSALTGSILFYAGLPYLFALPGEPEVPFGPAFPALAAVIALGTLAYRRSALSDSALRRRVEGMVDSRDTGPGTPVPRPVPLARIGFRRSLVGWAMTESIAVVGFVYALLSREPAAGLPFAAAALVLNLLAFPRLLELVERGKGWTTQGPRGRGAMKNR